MQRYTYTSPLAGRLIKTWWWYRKNLKLFGRDRLGDTEIFHSSAVRPSLPSHASPGPSSSIHPSVQPQQIEKTPRQIPSLAICVSQKTTASTQQQQQLWSGTNNHDKPVHDHEIYITRIKRPTKTDRLVLGSFGDPPHQSTSHLPHHHITWLAGLQRLIL